MAHEHPVRDTDLHFVIDPITRAIKNNSGKITLMQYDHQSEIFTFELPRYIDTHDMSICDKVRVHYINIGSSSKYEPVSGVYEITDLQIDPENEDRVTCSWLLTNNTTQLDGTLNFIIRFSCLTGETIDYSWSTAIYSGIVVSKTIDSTDEVMENTADILEQWKASLKGDPFTYEDFTPEQLEGLRGPAGIIISKTKPTSEDHPVWVNPDGEVGPPDLGITGATVGQVPVVKTVDENGAPTEWEAVELPSGAYIVNLTVDHRGNVTADKTFAEIKAASDNGKVVDAKLGVLIVPLQELTDSKAIFALTNANSRGIITDSLTCTSDNVWSMSEDGFFAHSLGLTGATVGQTVKIKAVDKNGIPTEWEAADVASGDDELPLLYHGKVSAEITDFTLSEIDGKALSLSEVKVYAVFKASAISWCGIDILTSAVNKNNSQVIARLSGTHAAVDTWYAVTASGKVKNGKFEMYAENPIKFIPYVNASNNYYATLFRVIPNFPYGNPPEIQEQNAPNGKINAIKVYGTFSELEVIVWGR